MPLTDTEWRSVEGKTLGRTDISNECPICYEKLGFMPQVVLNCSHVFHKSCIESYEKYTSQKCCPICRKSDYEKKPFTEGMKAYIDLSIKRIQGLTRGRLARILLYNLLSVKSYKIQNKKWKTLLIGYRLYKLNHKVIKAEKDFSNKVNKVLFNTELSSGTMDDIFKYCNLAHVEKKLESINKTRADKLNWEEIRKKADSLCQTTCSICYSGIQHKECTLLSCGHIYHCKCMESFEKYDILKTLKCPMCRYLYCRIPL